MSHEKTAIEILQNIYGYEKFRNNQEEIVKAVIAGENTVVIMPTGGGKSICYQIPAMFRNGVGIIISPLIALMQDQVLALKQLGVRAAFINSTMSSLEILQTMQDMENLDLLYVAPERLLMETFQKAIKEKTIALFAIDEAHCVSEWGHDFRPHYTELGVLAKRFPTVPRIALTATADDTTRHDIIDKLNLKNSKVFVLGFDRPNINYSIVSKKNHKEELCKFIDRDHKTDSGIVYCLSRKLCAETQKNLLAKGKKALIYHAGMGLMDRAKNQNDFLQGEGVIMVATIAFGMGIDKPNVRFVVHMNIPKNIECYYQETGRAGRDGLPADALMFYGLGDSAMQRNFIENGSQSEKQKRIEHQKLNALLGLCETSCCRRQIILAYFGDKKAECNNCDTCLNPPETFDGTLAAQKAISCVYRTRQRFGVSYLIDVLLGKESQRIKNFGHDKIKTFAVGPEYSKQEWQSIFRQLVAENIFVVDMKGHGGLKLSEYGLKFLKEKMSIKLCRPQKNKKEVKKKIFVQLTDNSDIALFKILKEKRAQLARENKVPSYVIFHDKTLEEMASLKPNDNESFRKLQGVGDLKLEKYGEIFMEIIRSHE